MRLSLALRVCALVALALLLCAGPAAAAASGDIRVAIAEGLRVVEVGGGPMMVSDLAGRAVVEDSPTWLRATWKPGALEVSGGGRRVDGLRLAPGDTGVLRFNGREYPGALEICDAVYRSCRSGEKVVL